MFNKCSRYARRISSDPAVERLGVLAWQFAVEVFFIALMINVYEGIRNQVGSQSGQHDVALKHALEIVNLEQHLGIFLESKLQSLFLGWPCFLQFWNIYYGSLHTVVSIAVLVVLFITEPAVYQSQRTIFLLMQGLAFLGYSLYPLMPPRLLPDCTSPVGGCQPQFTFVDTMQVYGGFWSWQSKSVSKYSNQYAAMPSMHSGYSLWVAASLQQISSPRWLKLLAWCYPVATLFCIVVTANHYFMDFIVGGLVLGISTLLQSFMPTCGRGSAELRERKAKGLPSTDHDVRGPRHRTHIGGLGVWGMAPWHRSRRNKEVESIQLLAAGSWSTDSSDEPPAV